MQFINKMLANEEAKVDVKTKIPDSKTNAFCLYNFFFFLHFFGIFIFVYLLK